MGEKKPTKLGWLDTVAKIQGITCRRLRKDRNMAGCREKKVEKVKKKQRIMAKCGERQCFSLWGEGNKIKSRRGKKVQWIIWERIVNTAPKQGPPVPLLTQWECWMKRLAEQLRYTMDKVSQSMSVQQKRLLYYVTLHNYTAVVPYVNTLEVSLFPILTDIALEWVLVELETVFLCCDRGSQVGLCLFNYICIVVLM